MGNRLVYNRAIIGKLSELIEKYPDWRFGQILINSEILELYYPDENIFPSVKDPFNEESEIIWKRMCDNKICFKNE